ncbi:MAG: hypothetical protein IV089_01385 [Thiobacillus sp.]|nr:hypothetical protein [Thiobacillus sp.]
MSTERIPRHEAWRRMYQANRYCRHLSQKELNQRVRDVFLNNLRLTPEAKIGLPPMGPDGLRGMELWTHVLEEMALRHGPYPNGFTRDILHSEPFPDLVGALGRKAASILSTRGLEPAEVFIKFGKAEHMQALFERGSMRIQSASYYATPSHNGAILDDELSLPLSLSLTRDDIVKMVLNPQDVPNEPLDQRLDITYSAGTDYWLYCVTTAVEPRLFVDFQADACVIIQDRERFQRLVTLQGAQHFSDTGHRHGDAIYVDPLLPRTAIIDVPMSKHFRYEYQKEYRFVWRPIQPRSNLPHVDVEVGSLKDIAELVVV